MKTLKQARTPRPNTFDPARRDTVLDLPDLIEERIDPAEFFAAAGANRTRLMTASELKRRELGDTAFGAGLVRHALYATWRAVEAGEMRDSLTWLRTEVGDYWTQREPLVAILRYLGALEAEPPSADAAAARLVAGAVDNDHV